MQNETNALQDNEERRDHKRASVLFSGCLISGDQTASGLLMDISAGGARIKLSTPLDSYSAVTLRMARSVDFHVEIAWVKENILGLRFRETPTKIASILAAILPQDCLAV